MMKANNMVQWMECNQNRYLNPLPSLQLSEICGTEHLILQQAGGQDYLNTVAIPIYFIHESCYFGPIYHYNNPISHPNWLVTSFYIAHLINNSLCEL